jgi:hypothetical protein
VDETSLDLPDCNLRIAWSPARNSVKPSPRAVLRYLCVLGRHAGRWLAAHSNPVAKVSEGGSQ